MQFLRQLIARWTQARTAAKTAAPGTLKPLRHEELARAVGGTDAPKGTW